MLKDVSGLLLAGGASSRFGSDKAMAPWAGGKLIEAGAAKSKDLFSETLVPVKDPDVYGFLSRPGLRLIADVSARRHPGVGLLTGLLAARTERVFAFACDMPHLSTDLMRFLCGVSPEAAAVVPVWNDTPQPMCAVYSAACIPVLEDLLSKENFSLKDLARRVGARYVSPDEWRTADAAGTSFMDIDTKEDHAIAEAACAR